MARGLSLQSTHRLRCVDRVPGYLSATSRGLRGRLRRSAGGTPLWRRITASFRDGRRAGPLRGTFVRASRQRTSGARGARIRSWRVGLAERRSLDTRHFGAFSVWASVCRSAWFLRDGSDGTSGRRIAEAYDSVVCGSMVDTASCWGVIHVHRQAWVELKPALSDSVVAVSF